ncbi:unnamed protein product [Onchocerca flexuosa]|uniref:Uncharacterized protein n=1 Tax=Onchocerca flexuosa TaxID=387005 RepID=A0A183I0Y9_9BILA|nr:unnamed protein product [Onchocerca flexuosa]
MTRYSVNQCVTRRGAPLQTPSNFRERKMCSVRENSSVPPQSRARIIHIESFRVNRNQSLQNQFSKSNSSDGGKRRTQSPTGSTT